MVRRAICASCLAFGASLALLAQAEEFKGEFKVDKKFSQVKKVALVDISGQAKESKDQTGPWTDDGMAKVAAGFRSIGREVVSGPAVSTAFQQIAPLPTSEDIKAALIKRKIKPADAEKTAAFLENSWKDQEPGDVTKLGYAFYRPDGSVNLERPMFNAKEEKSKNAEEKEVRRRMAVLRDALGVDAIARLEFGFGSWRYEEPGWQKSEKAKGNAIGIVPAISTIKGLLKGAKASAHIALTVFDADGKKEIVDIAGSCNSKQGTGVSLRGISDKIETWMPETMSACIAQLFSKIAEKEK
jgi:hypothetical protein